MEDLRNYIISEFPTVFTTSFSRQLLDNILIESEKIGCIADRCEWISNVIPEIRLNEVRDILLR
jgi:hypothetical protein